MAEPVAKLSFLLLAVFLALAPLLLWAERGRGPVPLRAGRLVSGEASEPFRPADLLHPLATLLRLLTREDVVPFTGRRGLHLGAAVAAVVVSLAVFCVIPFAGVYQFGERAVAMVVANPDWGLLLVPMLAFLGAYTVVLAGFASRRSEALHASLRAATQVASYQFPLALAAVSLFMVHGSLSVRDMALAQDETFRLFGFLPALGFLAPDFLLRFPFVWPAWGLFLQPVAALIVLACLLASSGRPPFDVEAQAGRAGYLRDYAGLRLGLFYLADLLQTLGTAALLATLFLGGWALPWISTAGFVDPLTPVVGTTVANAFCAGVHFATFGIKVALVVWLLVALRRALPRLSYAQSLSLCWKGLVPLALLNVLGTAVWLLAMGDSA